MRASAEASRIPLPGFRPPAVQHDAFRPKLRDVIENPRAVDGSVDVPALIESLESAPIGDGDLIGEPFKVLPYQARFLRGAFAPGVIRAGLSVARGGGKSGLASALVLDCVRTDGVLHRRGFEAVLIASAFPQGKIVFDAALASLRMMDPEADRFYRILDQQNQASIQNKETGARVRVVGADNRRAHGWRVNLVIGDEPAQWGPRGEPLAAAIRTALGKRRGSRVIFIGTRPANDVHFFARLLEDEDPSVFALTFAAGPGDDPLAEATWRKANPAMDVGMPDVETLRAEARLAARDPAELATFKALRLNMGVSEVEARVLLAGETWRGIEAEALPARDGPMALGLDLGATAAFSAAAAFWPRTGRLEGFVACGNEPALSERALADGVSGVYEAMRDAGELVQIGGRVVPVGDFLAEAIRRFGRPAAIAADRFRIGDLTDGVRASGLRLPEPTWRGQGWRDGAEDVRGFRTAVLESKVTVPRSLAMRAAFAEARTAMNPAGDEKLAKAGEGKRRRGRDDLAAAIVLAVAEGMRREAASKPRRRRGGLRSLLVG